MITEQELIDFGFTKNDDFPMIPFEKHLSDPNEDGGRLTLIVTIERNQPEIALNMPDGNKLFLHIESLQQLLIFENAIQSWDPNY